MLEPFEFTAQDEPHDFHAAQSVTYGELADCGFICWGDPAWMWDAYDNKQRERLQDKIAARFWYREIGILPWAAWRDQLIRKLNEVMPKYKILYKKLDAGVDMFMTSDDYEKGRHVYSDFPATLLNPDNGDYAANATDRESERVVETDPLEKYIRIEQGYKDVDVLILDELEPLFSRLLTVNFNAF